MKRAIILVMFVMFSVLGTSTTRGNQSNFTSNPGNFTIVGFYLNQNPTDVDNILINLEIRTQSGVGVNTTIVINDSQGNPVHIQNKSLGGGSNMIHLTPTNLAPGDYDIVVEDSTGIHKIKVTVRPKGSI